MSNDRVRKVTLALQFFNRLIDRAGFVGSVGISMLIFVSHEASAISRP